MSPVALNAVEEAKGKVDAVFALEVMAPLVVTAPVFEMENSVVVEKEDVEDAIAKSVFVA